MVSFHKKFLFFTIIENYFEYKFKISDLFTLNAYLDVKHSKYQIRWSIKKSSYSLEISLVQDIDLIFSGFSETVRSEIRKSQKEGVTCCFHNDTDGFVLFYNEFANYRGIPQTSVKRIREMGENMRMSYGILDGQIVSAHSYLVDKEVGIVKLFHSASRRFETKKDASKIGRSNKLLHYKDMIHFKEQGFTLYDFGGYAENTKDQGLKGINEFKLSFGGKKVICNNYYSVGYILLKKVAKFLKIIKHTV